jgi:uncharacterized UPF0160 family protein
MELRQALAQPEQEPVGYVTDSGTSAWILKDVDLDDDTPIYTAPPKREWVGLTDQEIHEIVYEQMEGQHPAAGFRVANCIESKLKEKNGA